MYLCKKSLHVLMLVKKKMCFLSFPPPTLSFLPYFLLLSSGFFSSSKSHLCSGSVAGAQSDDNRLDRLQTIQNTTLQLLRLFVLDLKARKTLIAVKYLHIYI